MPIAPPRPEISEDSIRNWVRMSERRAPSARRTPISRVRSVTDTSMMFMIPMPPTSSDTDAIAPSSIVSTPVICVAVEAISCCERITKSSSWVRPRRWRWRSRAVISSIAWSMLCGETAEIMMVSM